MDRGCPAGGNRQAGKVAEGMHHAGQAKPDQQKDKGVAEAEGVVDGASQHDREGDGEQHAGARRQDEYAALGQHNRQRLVTTKSKQPAPKLG